MTARKLQNFRREYLSGELREEEMPDNPYQQLLAWLEDAISSGIFDPTAMALATTGENGKPSVRIVILKEVREAGLVFFSNYESRKGRELEENPGASVMFFWNGLERQIRIEGIVEKLTASESDKFFDSRPLDSRIASIVSEQSQVIPEREELMHKFESLKISGDEHVKRPDYWGGYMLKPELYEFWQGREHRLNDRILYSQSNGSWQINRLAP